MTLAALLAGTAGREWLAAHGVHTDLERFHAGLALPAAPGVAALAGIGDARPVIYVGQQVAADFAHATASKFASARDIAAAGRVDCVITWHDMDRVGSDRFGMRVVFELGARVGVWLAPRKLENCEPRFIAVEPQRLDELFVRARNAVEALSPQYRQAARRRIDVWASSLVAEAPDTIADAARTLGTSLLREQLGVDLPWLYVSALMQATPVHEVLLELLCEHEGVIGAYNAAIDQLRRDDLDPGLRRLDDRWLPLWWSCPASGRRLRLVRVTDGADTYGVVDACPCGQAHRFHLGSRQPSIDELQAAGRWSPDVLLPVLLDELFSGYVAGQSSAIYGLPMRAVLVDALAREPIPAFLPDGAAAGPPSGPDSLLHAYLTAP